MIFEKDKEAKKLNETKNIFTRLKVIGDNFLVLKIRGIRIYMIGQLISLLGDGRKPAAKNSIW
jgi:hypothetical protein